MLLQIKIIILTSISLNGVFKRQCLSLWNSTFKNTLQFTAILMCLMKIRLNLFDDDIAYQFDVHKTTVPQNFTMFS